MKESGERGRLSFDPKAIEKSRPLVKVLEKLAKEKNTNLTGIALAYIYAKV